MDGVERTGFDKENSRLWRVHRTARQMCKDRGYLLTDEEVNISFHDFKQQYCGYAGKVERKLLNFSARPSEEMINKYTVPPTPGIETPQPECGTVYVEFCDETSAIGIGVVTKFVQHCASENFRSGILITCLPLSAQARKVLTVTTNYTQVECFIEEDLLVNITKHELVPTHVLLSKDEKMALLKRYRLKETQLPRILTKDPVARYMGLKRGQVVKIIRKSETAGRYASYRLCV